MVWWDSCWACTCSATVTEDTAAGAATVAKAVAAGAAVVNTVIRPLRTVIVALAEARGALRPSLGGGGPVECPH